MPSVLGIPYRETCFAWQSWVRHDGGTVITNIQGIHTFLYSFHDMYVCMYKDSREKII